MAVSPGKPGWNGLLRPLARPLLCGLALSQSTPAPQAPGASAEQGGGPGAHFGCCRRGLRKYSCSRLTALVQPSALSHLVSRGSTSQQDGGQQTGRLGVPSGARGGQAHQSQEPEPWSGWACEPGAAWVLAQTSPGTGLTHRTGVGTVPSPPQPQGLVTAARAEPHTAAWAGAELVSVGSWGGGATWGSGRSPEEVTGDICPENRGCWCPGAQTQPGRGLGVREQTRSGREELVRWPRLRGGEAAGLVGRVSSGSTGPSLKEIKNLKVVAAGH